MIGIARARWLPTRILMRLKGAFVILMLQLLSMVFPGGNAPSRGRNPFIR